jgi:hypothetical protein
MTTNTQAIPKQPYLTNHALLAAVFTLVAIALPAARCNATTIHVPSDYPTIQEGINAAVAGDIVEIADGVYTGPNNKNLDFYGKPITLRSASGDPTLCVIDCENDGRGFYFHWNERPNSVVEGLTITNGYADESSPGSDNGGGVYCEGYSSPTLRKCTISFSRAYGFPNGRGGGLCCDDSSDPTLINCIITDNSADVAGGIQCDGSSSPVLTNCIITNNVTLADYFGNGGGISCSYSSSPILTDCIIANNRAGGPFGAEGRGGGVSCTYSSNPTLTRCTITNNVADSGGGVYCWESSPVLTDCTITSNDADEAGGLLIWYLSNPTLTDCEISFNTVDWNAGGVYCLHDSDPVLNGCIIESNTAESGGGVYSEWLSAPTFINCLITLNTADGGEGGAVYAFDSSTPILTNCTLAGNSARYGAGLACDSLSLPSEVRMSNCILWNGPRQIWNNDESSLNFEYSDIEDGWPAGAGNINLDPLFADPGGGDFHLSAASPCIDSGDNYLVPFWITTDRDGNPRFVDDPGRHDNGFGMSPFVDMGCYEFQGDSTGITVLVMSPDPLLADQDADVTVINATPNRGLHLTYSLLGPGSTYVPFLNVTLDLESPRRIGRPALTDTGGNVRHSLPVPSTAVGRNIWFQAAQRELKTNVVATTIQ